MNRRESLLKLYLRAWRRWYVHERVQVADSIQPVSIVDDLSAQVRPVPMTFSSWMPAVAVAAQRSGFRVAPRRYPIRIDRFSADQDFHIGVFPETPLWGEQSVWGSQVASVPYQFEWPISLGKESNQDLGFGAAAPTPRAPDPFNPYSTFESRTDIYVHNASGATPVIFTATGQYIAWDLSLAGFYTAAELQANAFMPTLVYPGFNLIGVTRSTNVTALLRFWWSELSYGPAFGGGNPS